MSASHYSDDGFWNKVKKYAKKAGASVLEPALKMYFSSKDGDTPLWAKSTIVGALGYFIFPLDVIPDITPVVGYTDDLGVLTSAVSAVAAYIKDEHVSEAKRKLKQWLS